MKKIRLLASAAIAVGCLAVFAPAASAAAEVCYDVQAAAGGQELVNQKGCIPLP